MNKNKIKRKEIDTYIHLRSAELKSETKINVSPIEILR